MSPSQRNGWLLRVQHTLCVTDKINSHLLKKMEKRNLDIWMISSLLMTSHYLKVASYIQMQIIKPATVVKKRSYPEVIYKKGVLKNLQNSQENPCASISFLIKLRLKKRLWNRCFPVNIAKFLRTTFL